jgi:hypothetical protein
MVDFLAFAERFSVSAKETRFSRHRRHVLVFQTGGVPGHEG